MTIAEIESTLRALCIRHQNLDEQLLVTLLTAGGWEDKAIKDALTLFKASPDIYKTAAHAAVLLPNVQSATLPTVPTVEMNQFTSVVPETKLETTQSPKVEINTTLVSSPNTEASSIVYFKDGGEEETTLPVFSDAVAPMQTAKVPLQKVPEAKQVTLSEVEEVPLIDLSEKIEIPHDEIIPVLKSVGQNLVKKEEFMSVQAADEPQSLIVPSPEIKSSSQISLPPENLPLKPFESTPHVWPFSKYKEVFHGDSMPVLKPDERILVESEKPAMSLTPPSIPKIKIKRTGFDGEDEGLIFLTSTTLLVILLLLAYMYSNGRI